MTSTQTNPAEAPPPVDLRPHAVAYLANNLRTNGYEHHARTMEALASLRAVAEPSAEEAAALYRASMTETKGGFTEAIHHFARVLLSRYGAHKPDGGDAALLQTLIGNCSSCDTHYVKKGEHEGKPRSILLTLRAGENTNPRMQEQLRVIMDEFAGHCAAIAQQGKGEGGE